MAVKQLSNPFSTGGGGTHFESHVQASFIVLMLTNGWVPCLRNGRISKIQFQAKIAGYHTDDIVIFTETIDNKADKKLLGQIKHEITVSSSNAIFQEVINGAWNDFSNQVLFQRNRDVIGLITGPLSATDIADLRTILEWARNSQDYTELSDKIKKARFSNKGKKTKFKAFHDCLCKANGNTPPKDEEIFAFLRHFHVLGYDLDIKSGVILALLQSLISQYSERDIEGIWSRIVCEAMTANQNAGAITRKSLPKDIIDIFSSQTNTIPPFLTPQSIISTQTSREISSDQSLSGAIAALLGAWQDSCTEDTNIVRRLVDGL